MGWERYGRRGGGEERREAEEGEEARVEDEVEGAWGEAAGVRKEREGEEMGRAVEGGNVRRRNNKKGARKRERKE